MIAVVTATAGGMVVGWRSRAVAPTRAAASFGALVGQWMPCSFNPERLAPWGNLNPGLDELSDALLLGILLMLAC